jgi:hypothetical protein
VEREREGERGGWGGEGEGGREGGHVPQYCRDLPIHQGGGKGGEGEGMGEGEGGRREGRGGGEMGSWSGRGIGEIMSAEMGGGEGGADGDKVRDSTGKEVGRILAPLLREMSAGTWVWITIRMRGQRLVGEDLERMAMAADTRRTATTKQGISTCVHVRPGRASDSCDPQWDRKDTKRGRGENNKEGKWEEKGKDRGGGRKEQGEGCQPGFVSHSERASERASKRESERKRERDRKIEWGTGVEGQSTDPAAQPLPASMRYCGAHTPQSPSAVAAPAVAVVRPAGQGTGAEAPAGQKAPTGQGWPGSTVPVQKLLMRAISGGGGGGRGGGGGGARTGAEGHRGER